MKKQHALCRPPRGAGKPHGTESVGLKEVDIGVNYPEDEPFRLGEDGKWRPDNGRPARAFLYKLDGNFFACIADCDCPYTNGCPLGTALSKADDLGITAINVDRRRRVTVRESKQVLRKKFERKKKAK